MNAPNNDTHMINLADMPQGKTMRIAKVDGSAQFIKKLENLGVRIGDPILKVNAHILKGPVIINVKNSQIALGHTMAKKIWGIVE